MLGGLQYSLLGILVTQWLVGIPLLIQVKILQKPSKVACSLATQPPGVYIVSTLGACVAVLLATSVWEVVDLSRPDSEPDHQMAMVASLQRTKAQLVILICASILAMGFLLPRLANKIIAHDQLKASHEALLKQASSLTKEYQRATTGSAGDHELEGDDDVTHLNHQIDKLVKQKETLEQELDEAQEHKRKAETSLEAVTKQYRHLETSYDDLLERNRGLEVRVGMLNGAVAVGGPTDKKSD